VGSDVLVRVSPFSFVLTLVEVMAIYSLYYNLTVSLDNFGKIAINIWFGDDQYVKEVIGNISLFGGLLRPTLLLVLA